MLSFLTNVIKLMFFSPYGLCNDTDLLTALELLCVLGF